VRFQPSRALVLFSVLAVTTVGLFCLRSFGGSPSNRQLSARTVDAEPEHRHSPRPSGAAAQLPRDFAISVAKAMYHYDARTPRATWRSAVFTAAGIAESTAAAQDIDDVIPDAGQWTDMATVNQRASFTLGTAFVPTLWTQTVAQHPDLPDGSVGFTVTGAQVVTWPGGTSRVPVAITFLLLCPPATAHCVVNRVLAQVAR
jgi:hypothetical protein